MERILPLLPEGDRIPQLVADLITSPLYSLDGGLLARSLGGAVVPFTLSPKWRLLPRPEDWADETRGCSTEVGLLPFTGLVVVEVGAVLLLLLAVLMGLMYILRATRMEDVPDGDVLLGGVMAGLDLMLIVIGDFVVTCRRQGLLVSLLRLCC